MKFFDDNRSYHQHCITTHSCEIGSDTAHAESVVFASRRRTAGPFDSAAAASTAWARDGEWRIAVRRDHQWRAVQRRPMSTRRQTSPEGTWDKSDLSYLRPLSCRPSKRRRDEQGGGKASSAGWRKRFALARPAGYFRLHPPLHPRPRPSDAGLRRLSSRCRRQPRGFVGTSPSSLNEACRRARYASAHHGITTHTRVDGDTAHASYVHWFLRLRVPTRCAPAAALCRPAGAPQRPGRSSCVVYVDWQLEADGAL